MKRLQSLVLAVLLLGALTSPAWADDDHNGQGNGNGHALGRDFHRGNIGVMTLASGRASAGQVDPTITVLTDAGTSQSAVVCSNLVSGWANPLPRSNWVSLQADCTTPLADSTDYFYNISFNMPPNFTTARVEGRVLADDSVTVQVNGTTIFTGGGFGSPTTFSSNNSSLFVPGTNTLSFVVNNVTGASGLDYVARVEVAGQFHRSNQDRDDNGDD
jgi:hypothetical protein